MAARRRTSEEEETPQASLWERLERPPRTALSPDKIASAAVRIADAEGLDAVTMRRLAAELKVAPMAAYRYVTGKSELLELMADHVHGELELPDASGDWREVMRTLALRHRELMLRHPWLVSTTTVTLTPHQMGVWERALASLDSSELDPDSTMAVVSTVLSYVRGAVNGEIGRRLLLWERGWSSGEEMRYELAPQMIWLMETGRYPTYHRYVCDATRKDDPLWQFETGLDCVLDGIAARFGLPAGDSAAVPR